MCSKMVSKINKNFDKDPIVLLNAIYEGVNIYQNFTGNTKCMNLYQDLTVNLSSSTWDYQVSNVF
jgi:hypothetical protein